jgi:2-isopropylmalate synthase
MTAETKPMDPNRVVIFDTTLRDAEQSPGASLNLNEKLEVAHQLKRLGVDIIEAGFPVSSKVQFEAVKRISEEVQGPVIAGLARTVAKDIESAGAALEPAPRNRIHTFTSSSPEHMKYMLRMTPAEVLEKAVEAVRLAKSFTDDVEFSAQDVPRSDIQFVRELLTAVIEAGATTLNIPDTVGYALPTEYGALIADLKANVPGIDKAILSTHCHNDLGLATANSLAGVLNGARQIECTINGLGERAGNASLEEVVMAIKVREDLCHVHTQVISSQLYPTSRLVSRLMGIFVQPNKAIVGENAFAHASGIHQDGVLKEAITYEIMTPESVGVPGSRMVLDRHSGRHAFKARSAELGVELSDQMLNQAFEKFKDLADKKKEVYDEDIIALLEEEFEKIPQVFHLEFLQCAAGTGTIPSATVRIRKDDEILQEAAWGDGPVDATYNAIRKATGIDVELETYNIRAVTESSEALGEAILHIRSGDKVFVGRGVSTDIIEASAKAYISALNHMLARGNGGNDDQNSVNKE